VQDQTQRKTPSILGQIRNNKDIWTERIEHMEGDARNLPCIAILHQEDSQVDHEKIEMKP
jgi:hypothetical protein